METWSRVVRLQGARSRSGKRRFDGSCGAVGRGAAPLLAAVVALTLGASRAQAQGAAWVVKSTEPVIVRLLELPEGELKALYVRCSEAAQRNALPTGEIAACSVVYEVLLQHTFGGDFLALRSWSSSVTAVAPAAPPPGRPVQRR